MRLFIFALLVGITMEAIIVNRVKCGALADLKDMVTGGGEDNKDESKDNKNKDNKDEKDKEDSKSMYQGGLMQQIAHSATDVLADRAADYIQEQKTPGLLKPVVGAVAKSFKKKIHTRINEMDDDKEKEEEKEGEKKEEHKEEAVKERGEEYKEQGEGIVDEFKDAAGLGIDNESKQDGNPREKEQESHGLFEKFKDMVGSGEKKDRRKRSADDEAKPKGRMSRLFKKVWNLIPRRSKNKASGLNPQ